MEEMTKRREENLLLFSQRKIIYIGKDWEQFAECTDETAKRGFCDSIGKCTGWYTAEVSLLVNLTDMSFLLEFESRNQPSGGNLRPVYLYYDEPVFCYMLDYLDLKPITENFRFVLIVGKDSLLNLFRDIEVVFPMKVYECDSDVVAGTMEELFRERVKLEEKMTRLLNLYYASNKTEIYQKIIEKRATIAILHYGNEPKAFREYYMDLKTVWEKMGFQVVLVQPSGFYCQTNSIYHCFTILPDLVFQINKSRDGAKIKGERLRLSKVKELLVVNWIQDFTQEFFGESAIANLTDNDLIVSIFDKNFWNRYKVDGKQIIYGGIQGINPKVIRQETMTQEEHRNYDCDINFGGSFLLEEFQTNFILLHMEGKLREKELELFMQLVQELQVYTCEGNRYQTDEEKLYELADRFRVLTKCEDEIYQLVIKVFYLTRYQQIRRKILKDLGQSNKFRIYAYAGFENPCHISGYGNVVFREFIHDKGEYAKALCCSQMTLQMNPDTILNRRVGEACLCGSIPMILNVDPQYDICGGHSYLKGLSSRNFFESKEELIENITYFLEHKEEKEKHKKVGQKIARKEFTIETVYTDMMGKIIKKVMVMAKNYPGNEKRNSYGRQD